jgi:predicted RNase H-like nuclease (RuvC/YqgF family)
MSADDKAAAAWDDYVSQQQEEKIEELERELNAANESFRKLNIHTLNLVDRIRRLEEAGDAMINEGWNEPHLANAWRKAKEAKP